MDSMDENTRKNDELSKSKFQPKVPPTEYQRFIYKCHDCMLGFKRRGRSMKIIFLLEMMLKVLRLFHFPRNAGESHGKTTPSHRTQLNTRTKSADIKNRAMFLLPIL